MGRRLRHSHSWSTELGIVVLKFLQINLNRGRTAHGMLIQTVHEKETNIIIGQEPNKKIAAVKVFCDID